MNFNIPYLLAHFIGDFLLQSDWMATRKKQSNIACSIHVILYMLPFIFVELSLIQFILIAFQHWIQDRSKFIAWYCKTFGIFQGELKQKVLPWGHFIIDQIFHVIWMYVVMNFVI